MEWDTLSILLMLIIVFLAKREMMVNYEHIFLMCKLPSYAELAACVVCGFISDLSSKHCSATDTFEDLHCIHG